MHAERVTCSGVAPRCSCETVFQSIWLSPFSCAAPWRTSGPRRHTRVPARAARRSSAVQRFHGFITSRSEARAGGEAPEDRRRLLPLEVKRALLPGASAPTVRTLRRSARRRSSPSLRAIFPRPVFRREPLPPCRQPSARIGQRRGSESATAAVAVGVKLPRESSPAGERPPHQRSKPRPSQCRTVAGGNPGPGPAGRRCGSDCLDPLSEAAAGAVPAPATAPTASVPTSVAAAGAVPSRHCLARAAAGRPERLRRSQPATGPGSCLSSSARRAAGAAARSGASTSSPSRSLAGRPALRSCSGGGCRRRLPLPAPWPVGRCARRRRRPPPPAPWPVGRCGAMRGDAGGWRNASASERARGGTKRVLALRGARRVLPSAPWPEGRCAR
jgi:hypothetical protein